MSLTKRQRWGIGAEILGSLVHLGVGIARHRRRAPESDSGPEEMTAGFAHADGIALPRRRVVLGKKRDCDCED